MLPNSTTNALTQGREGFDYDKDGNFQGAGGEQAIDLLRIHYIYAYLGLELKTGMKYSNRVNLLALANEAMGTNYKRKQQAYDNMTHLLLEAGELRLNTEGEEA